MTLASAWEDLAGLGGREGGSQKDGGRELSQRLPCHRAAWTGLCPSSVSSCSPQLSPSELKQPLSPAPLPGATKEIFSSIRSLLEYKEIYLSNFEYAICFLFLDTGGIVSINKYYLIDQSYYMSFTQPWASHIVSLSLSFPIKEQREVEVLLY